MNINEFFGPAISTYTEEQAIEDGVLHHLWPEQWPWLLLTDTIYARAEQVAFTRGDVPIETVLTPLAMDAIVETQRQMRLNPRCDLVELEYTAVGTVWIRPNSKGGMTIMDPEDN
jgi:hypothetical protein